MSVSPTGHAPNINRPAADALRLTIELSRRALRADAAFVWTSNVDAPALLCSSGSADALDAALGVRDMVFAASDPVRHEDGSHAWLGIDVRLGRHRGAVCVAASAPRDFDDQDLAVVEAVRVLIQALEDPPHPPLQKLVDLSDTLLRQTQDVCPTAFPVDALLAAADSLESVAARMRELGASNSRSAASPAARRILLADDLDLNRRLIADMLSLDGHRVDCVTDGAAAVRAVSAERYDLVLMDMVMPEMDGLAATRAIRALPRPARDVPIVALTANAMRDQLDSCLAAGMDAALAKPMSLEALNAAVAHWTRGRHAAA